MMDNTKLIERAYELADTFPDSSLSETVEALIAALEAAEAELTRRDTTIEQIRAAVAAAPVSLEAVKAETTTEWRRVGLLGNHRIGTSAIYAEPPAPMERFEIESREVTEWRPVETEEVE